MVTRVRMDGLKDLEKALLELSQKEAKRIGRAAVRKAARQIANAAKDRVPVREGRLKRAIEVRVQQRFADGSRKGIIDAIVRVSGRAGPRPRKSDRQSTVKGKLGPARYNYQIGSAPNVYGAFIEFGTGDTRPLPFMRPAWDVEGGEVALVRIGRDLGDGLEKAAAKLGKGG